MRRRRRRRRIGCGRALRVGPGRQECERIEIAVRLGRQPNAEVHVRLGMLRLSARADGADHVALGKRRPKAHGDRAEMHERDRVPVRSTDREREARRGHGAGEPDDARHRRPNLGAARRADVEATMLPAEVRVVFQRETAQDRPVDGPAPGRGRRCEQERAQRYC
jgi:hypothetical protein